MTKTVINTDSVFIGGIEYIPKNSQVISPNYDGPIKIVALQRGWVYIGRYSIQPSGLCVLNNAYGIQNWGTTKGLPELVNGPTSKTILNKCDGEITFNKGSELFTIGVNESQWKQI